MADPNTTDTSTHEDPLLIQSSDHPGLKLVSHSFEGTGYANWKRSMLIALSAKNKLCFIDGSLSKPSPSTSSAAKSWQRCNDMVFSWILNTLSPPIADSILYSSTAKVAWDELEARFGKANGAQMYSLHKKLSEFSQGTESITSYFTRLKTLWDEIDAASTVSVCSCSCTCGSRAENTQHNDSTKVIQFLMGLNDSYNVTRGTILIQNPLPKLSTVYNNLLQEEQQREVHHSAQFQMDSASFLARNNRFKSYLNGGANNFSQKQSSTADQRKTGYIECKFCKKPGHTIDKCFKLQNRNKKFAGHVQVNDTSGILGAYNPGNHASSSDNPTSNAGQFDPNSSSSQNQFTAANFAGLFFEDAADHW